MATGDVEVIDGDAFGENVNLASRILSRTQRCVLTRRSRRHLRLGIGGRQRRRFDGSSNSAHGLRHSR
jgi:class 3 adenylate cyclase